MSVESLQPSRTFTTRVDVPLEAREFLIPLLDQQLADALDLRSQCKQAHWNVKGMQFHSLHELFDELAAELDAQADKIAERIAALGGYAQGTVRMAAATSSREEYPIEAVSGEAHVTALAERFARYGSGTRAAVEKATQYGDAATADLFTELSRAIDHRLWLLEAHLQR